MLIVLVTNYCMAQTEEVNVKTVVNNLFIAMKTGDTVLLAACFSEGAILQTIDKKTGIVKIENESLADFKASVAKQPKGSLDERISFDIVKVDDDLAIVWTPYSFYYKDKFSHCGVNSFQLVRIAGSWKIQYLIDTRRKNDCK